jgi:undecaprenyl diphosphate synthase
MALFRAYLASDAPRLIEGGARLSMIGRRDRLPADLAAAVAQIEAATALNDRLNLRIALDYSSREAIALAAVRLGSAATLDDLDRLITGDPQIGPVDLLIRTGGEQRLSDFMLWECAFAELWFTRRMWPEFNGADLAEAIGDFRRRTRTFGAVLGEAPEPRGGIAARRTCSAVTLPSVTAGRQSRLPMNAADALAAPGAASPRSACLGRRD